jgi:hypothetical protein
MTAEYRTWVAIKKLCNDEFLTAQEWEDVSWLTLIDRNRLEFAPGSFRWATSDAERAENLAFYQSLGAPK